MSVGSHSLYRAGGKRLLDLTAAAFGLLLLGWLILIGWLIARVSTGHGGFFVQQRVGRDGAVFGVMKLRTMRPSETHTTTATTQNDPRITRAGRWLRRLRIDELPQLWNVFRGQMSLVGPRPDVAGFADTLTGEAREILALRPGITGSATLAFSAEEALLAHQTDPEAYNADVVWPAKVAINLRYAREYGFLSDMALILATFLPTLRRTVAPPFQSDATR